MDWIFLRYPFVKHYQGSIFLLDKNKSGWDNNTELFEEKVLPLDNRYYLLPDNGLGSATMIPISQVSLLEPEIAMSFDCRSGPLRVTYVSQGLHHDSYDHYLSTPYPQGKGSIRVISNGKGVGHYFQLPSNLLQSLDLITLTNRQNDEVSNLPVIKKGDHNIDGSNWLSGFYIVHLITEEGHAECFHCIKCYPVYVNTHNKDIVCFEPTRW